MIKQSDKNKKLIDYLTSQDYHHIKVLDTGDIAAIAVRIFGFDIVSGLDYNGLAEAWSYKSLTQAKQALAAWTGQGDPGNNWHCHMPSNRRR